MAKILVVDDDPVDLRMVQSFLQSKGYQVRTAEDGQKAMILLKTEQFDLVVLDVMMPEMNGYDICYELRFNPEHQQVPIVLLTYRDQEIDEELSKRMNIEYAPKPVDATALFDKISLLLKN